MHVLHREIGSGERVTQNNGIDGIHRLLGKERRVETTVADAVGKQQHGADIPFIITALHHPHHGGKVSELVGEIELVELAHLLSEEVVVHLKIVVQRLAEIGKTLRVISLEKSRVLAQHDG